MITHWLNKTHTETWGSEPWLRSPCWVSPPASGLVIPPWALHTCTDTAAGQRVLQVPKLNMSWGKQSIVSSTFYSFLIPCLASNTPISLVPESHDFRVTIDTTLSLPKANQVWTMVSWANHLANICCLSLPLVIALLSHFRPSAFSCGPWQFCLLLQIFANLTWI